MRHWLPPVPRQAGSPPRVAPDPRLVHAPPTRGVVIRTHFADDAAGDNASRAPRGVTCDVMTWSSRGGNGRLSGVPVLQRGSTVGNASLWVPRAGTRTLDGDPLSWDGDPVAGVAAVDPENVDGEWVLVEFIDGDYRAPIIVGSIQHPRSRRPQNGATPAELVDVGADGAVGTTPDGLERFLAHQGTVARVDRAGNVVVDTSAGGQTDAGDALEGTSGHVDLNLAADATLTVRFAGTRQLRLRVVDGEPQLDLMVGGRPMARLDDFVTIDVSTSPAFIAWMTAVTGAINAVPGSIGSISAIQAQLDAVLAWAAAPAPPNSGRAPLAGVPGAAAPPAVPGGLPAAAPGDAHAGGPVGAPQVVGQITSASAQVRGA